MRTRGDQTHARETCRERSCHRYSRAVPTPTDTSSPVHVTSPRTGLVARAYAKLAGLYREIAKFGIVGLSALVVDIGLFNLLLYFGPLEGKPLTAKIVSVAAATTVAYFGNRFWTFKHRGRTSFTREYVLFFALNGVAMLIAVGCLWFSHYALGLDSPLADNISATVVGLALGTMFRFWSYRKFVFPEVDDETERERLLGTVEI